MKIINFGLVRTYKLNFKKKRHFKKRKEKKEKINNACMT